MNIVKINKEQIINSKTIELFKNKITFENFDFKDEIYLGIRPEDISIKTDREIKLDVKVDLIENLGFEKIIYTHINGSEIRIKSTQNIKDKNITIYLPKNKLYLFDINRNKLKT